MTVDQVSRWSRYVPVLLLMALFFSGVVIVRDWMASFQMP